jgi:hypothetical protein
MRQPDIAYGGGTKSGREHLRRIANGARVRYALGPLARACDVTPAAMLDFSLGHADLGPAALQRLCKAVMPASEYDADVDRIWITALRPTAMSGKPPAYSRPGPQDAA